MRHGRHNDPSGDRVELVGRVSRSEVSQLWVLGEELCHAFFQFGYLSQFAELRLVLVEVGIKRLSLVYKLRLLCQAIDDSLEEDAGIWTRSVTRQAHGTKRNAYW